ncbi:MAG: LytTR family DNA-binding domain-containing protein [Marinicella sp.]
MSLRIVIVEDSRLAQNELLELLKPYKTTEVIGTAKTVQEALVLINKQLPDLLLLDINLPDGTGFDLLNQLNPCPQVIFTTAYDEYAIKAFEQNALDYLLKPINEKRFNQALEKALQQPQSVNNSIIDHKIFVKDNDQCWLVDIQKIRYFVSHGNYTQLFFDEHHPMVYRSLNQIEQRLPVNQFFRVNRSHIININFVKHIEAYGQSGLLLTMDDDTEIDVSRRHASHLKQALSL